MSAQQDDIAFTIRIAGWTSQVRGYPLPICEVVSPIEICNPRMDMDGYASEHIHVHERYGQYLVSFVFWSAARVHLAIADVDLFLVNLEDKIGIVFHSRAVNFAVFMMKNDEVVHALFANEKAGVRHCFAVLQDSRMIQVKVEK